MTNTYKLIQLTNTTIGEVPANSFVPFGSVTRRINAPYSCCNTFTVSSSNADSVVLNDAGFYKITYSLTAEAADVGTVTVALVTNGTTAYSVSQYLAEAASPVNMTLVYTVRGCAETTTALTTPITVQVQNTGIALTGSTSNLIIEKIG